MRFKVYIDYTGTGYQEIFPDNVSPFKITRSQTANEIMQYFSRVEWGIIQLSNNPYLYSKTGLTIHALFDVINLLDFSTKILVKHETPLKTIFGYFGRNDCTFDYDKKIVTVTPAVIDKYTPVLENWEKEVDFTKYVFDGIELAANIATTTVKTIKDWPTTEGSVQGTQIYPRNLVKEDDYNNEGLLSYFDGQAPKKELFADSYWGFAATHNVWDNQDPNFQNIPVASFSLLDRVVILGQSPSDNSDDSSYGPSLDIHYGDYELSMFRVYEGTRTGGLSGNRWRQLYCETEFTREEIRKVDVVDNNNKFGFESPVGDGWSMRKPITMAGGNSAHIWTRKPFNGGYSENWTLGPEVISTSVAATEFNYYKYRETRLDYSNATNTFKLKTSIKLNDFIDYITDSSDSELSGLPIKSTFLFNDFENEVGILNGTTGYNYVTGMPNQLNNLRLFFTKDLMTLDKNEVKDIPKYTMKGIFDELNTTFAGTLMWFIDSNGYLRIEHIAFIDLVKNNSKDLTENTLLIETSKWDFDKSMMFERFEYKQVNAGYIDFTDNYVSFNQVVSNNRNNDLKSELKTKLISTDLKYCIFNPTNLSDGFVLMAVDEFNVVINKECPISGEIEVNGAIALSNILLDFRRYEGIDSVGVMNGKNVNFKTIIRNKQGIEITLKGTVEYMFYITQLGFGMIDSGTIDFVKENTKIKLRYRFNSTVNTDMFVLSYQNKRDFEGAVNVWANQGNFIKL